MLDLISIFLGIMIGMLIMLIIVWGFYNSRTLFFTHCPVEIRYCQSEDYINAPTVREKENLHITNGKLYYRRVLNGLHGPCIPDIDQTVEITHPPVCLFQEGTTRFTGRMVSAGKYQGENGATVLTYSNCQPQDPGMTGVPLPEV